MFLGAYGLWAIRHDDSGHSLPIGMGHGASSPRTECQWSQRERAGLPSTVLPLPFWDFCAHLLLAKGQAQNSIQGHSQVTWSQHSDVRSQVRPSSESSRSMAALLCSSSPGLLHQTQRTHLSVACLRSVRIYLQSAQFLFLYREKILTVLQINIFSFLVCVDQHQIISVLRHTLW